MAVGASIELYDSDILKIEEVLNKLNEKVGTNQNYESLEREIRGRFAEIDLVAEVSWYEYAVSGQKIEGGAMPEITITGRIELEKEFDHDRLRHEVVQNILDLPGQTPGELIKPDQETVRRFVEGHSGHDHEC
jgi:hypothetical protein